MKIPENNPEIVVRDGKPVAVILDIDVYEELLEQVEGVEDLEYLQKSHNFAFFYILNLSIIS
jgi:hypothetical protein